MTTTLLVVLDVYSGLAPDSWVASPVPPENQLLLTAFGFVRPETGAPHDWLQLGMAIEKLADRVLERVDADPDEMEILIGGQAPLSLFVHLGYRLSKFVGKQIFRGVGPAGGAVESFDLSMTSNGTRFFDHEPNFTKPPAFGTGVVALSIDSAGRSPLEEAIVETLRSTGQAVLDLVALATEKPKVIGQDSAPQVALELTQLLSVLPSKYPRRDGMALFVAGPTLLAFLVGRALNPSIVGKVLLTNFEAQVYRIAYSLPFERPPIELVDRSPEAQLRRLQTKTKIVAAIDALRSELTSSDVDDPLLTLGESTALVAQLSTLRVADQDGPEFSLSLAQGELCLGEPLIEGISKLGDEKISDLAKLFVLHELVHDAQGLRTTNFQGVGRAAVALEQVDYVADAFALRTLMRIETRRGGEKAREQAPVRSYAVRLLNAILSGIEAFDEMAHGSRIDRLSERRLRRYLIWHLQHARASTLLGAEDFARLLRERVAVELAPLTGRIDLRTQEKIVTRSTPETSLFIAVDGRLIRVAPSRNLDPAAVLEALRTFGRTPLEQLMNFVVEEHRRFLAPWRS